MPLSFLAIWSLALRELKRFIRQRNRVFGALAQPLIFWALFGVGLSPSFRAGGSASVDYFEYFFPGTVVLILLFTAIFATISIIDDRNAGFLQSVLVAPVSRTSIVGGKILGTTILSVGQAALVLAFAPFAGISLGPLEVIGTLLLMVVIAVGLAGLGVSIAWRMDSTQGFHAIMMSFLMPMWFLSGAFFPSAGLPLWLKTLVTINPLTYGLAAVRRVLYWSKPGLVGDVPALAPSVFATIAFAVAMIALSTRIASAHENPVRGT